MWQDVSTPRPKLRVKKRNRALGLEITDASSRAPQNPTNPLKKILSEETRRRKAKYTVTPFSPSTLPKYYRCMPPPLSQFKEGRKKRIRKKDICILILSADNIADTLNMCPHILKTLLYFISLLVLKFIHCVVCLSSCLLHVPFQLHSPQFILAKCPIRPFKNITRETGIVDYDK